MKYPKTIQIGAHSYKVEINPHSAFVDNMCRYMGRHDYNNLQIGVAIRDQLGGLQCESVTNACFWHEVTHAVSQNFSLELEDKVVECIGQGITQALSSMGIKVVEYEESDA
jgi:hypothetical protein